MEKLYHQLKGDPIEILSVSIDTSGVSAVNPFMKKHNLTFPALMDTQGIIKIAFNTTGVPESFIIDREGFLVKKIIGSLDWAALGVLELFRRLIQKSTP